jgi:hypothetical protein
MRSVRKWYGRTHVVTVTEEGFAYAGRCFPSLPRLERLEAASGCRPAEATGADALPVWRKEVPLGLTQGYDAPAGYRMDWTSVRCGALLCVFPGPGGDDWPGERSYPAGLRAHSGASAVTALMPSITARRVLWPRARP